MLHKRASALTALVLAGLTACSPAKRANLPTADLDSGIGSTIGDPTTCVLLANPSGKIVYSYGDHFNCVRGLPACDRPGMLSAKEALSLAATPPRGASCPSNADASRRVGWAEGNVYKSGIRFRYSAVMEGQTALPGLEMNTRLADVFGRSGYTSIPGKQ